MKWKLGEKNPGVIVPPLPEKDVIQKYSMGTDFIERRCHALNVFVNRLCAHPVLKFSSELQFFLEAAETAWQAEVAAANQDKGVVKKGLFGAKKFCGAKRRHVATCPRGAGTPRRWQRCSPRAGGRRCSPRAT